MNIFEPIIKDILRLVDDQVQKALAQPGGQGLKVNECPRQTAFHRQSTDTIFVGNIPGWRIRLQSLPQGAT